MSGLVKGIKKVFKKAIKVVKKVAPYVALGAAIYFTAGLASGAFGGAGAAAGAVSGAGSGVGGFSSYAAGMSALSGGTAAAGAGLTQAGLASAGGGGFLKGLIGKIGGVFGGGGGGAAAAAGGAAKMSLTEKLMIASMGSNVLSSLVAPSSRDLAREQAIEAAKFRGSYYGLNEGDPLPNQPELMSRQEPPGQQLQPPGGRDLFADINAQPMMAPQNPNPQKGVGTQFNDYLNQNRPGDLYA